MTRVALFGQVSACVTAFVEQTLNADQLGVTRPSSLPRGAVPRVARTLALTRGMTAPSAVCRVMVVVWEEACGLWACRPVASRPGHDAGPWAHVLIIVWVALGALKNSEEDLHAVVPLTIW